MALIINIRDYNPSTDINYASKPKINNVGGKNIPIINGKTKKATYLSTPLMLTWGLNEFVDDKTNKHSYELSLQFPSEEYPDADGEMFLQKMKEFEEKIKNDAVTYSKEWFNKPKMTSEVVDALFTPMLKYPKNKDTQDFDYTRAPSLRVKIPYWENEWKFELYDMGKKQIWPNKTLNTPLELIPKLSRVACVLQCGGIWLANGKFGVTWKLFQAIVKLPQSLKGKCHIVVNDDNNDNNDNDYNSQKSDSTNEENNYDYVGVSVQDSDAEEENKIMQNENNNQTNENDTNNQNNTQQNEEDTPTKKKIIRRKKNE